MIDLTNLKSPGWQRVVGELCAPCGDDRLFLERLLSVMARVSAARQAVLFVATPTAAPSPGAPADAAQLDVRPLSICPAQTPAGSATASDQARRARTVGEGVGPVEEGVVIEYATDVRSAAWGAIESGQSRAFGLEAASALYDAAPANGFVLSIPLFASAEEPRAIGAVTLLIEPRSKQAVQSTLAMAEVLAGYTHGHAARQSLRRAQSASKAMDLATRLISGLNAAPGFKGSSLHVVNDLSKFMGAERAAMGWAADGSVKLVALSDTEHIDRRMSMVEKLERAMDECMDQEQPILHPAPSAEDDVVLAQSITQSHRELAGVQPNLRIASVPLRDGEKVLGVLTVEAVGGVLDVSAVELLQAAMDLVAPVLRVRRADDRWLWQRASDAALRGGSWMVGVKHTGWKLAGLAVLIASLVLVFYTTTYRVGAQAILQPRGKQVIAAPFDGLLRSVPTGIEAGRVVKAGELLAQMDTAELILQAEDAKQKIVQSQKQIAMSRSENKMAEAQKAEAQVERARADLEYAQSRIDRSRILAPIDGTIIAGRLNDRVGSALKLGDRLFEVAPLDDLIAVARVDERDVGLILEGGGGRLATRSHPAEAFELVIETIVPLAEASEGKNLFEVRARLTKAAPWMRPGMEGVAKLDAGERSLLSIASRRVVDAVRLWLW